MEYKDAYDLWKDKKQDERDSLQELRDLENKLKNETERADIWHDKYTQIEEELNIIKAKVRTLLQWCEE